MSKKERKDGELSTGGKVAVGGIGIIWIILFVIGMIILMCFL